MAFLLEREVTIKWQSRIEPLTLEVLKILNELLDPKSARRLQTHIESVVIWGVSTLTKSHEV